MTEFQLGIGDSGKSTNTPVRIDTSNLDNRVLQIYAGKRHSIINTGKYVTLSIMLKTRLYIFGHCGNLQCGNEDPSNLALPTIVDMPSPLKGCAAEDYALFITEEGLYVFGDNQFVRCNNI